MRVGYLLRYWPTLTETFVAGEIAALQRRMVHVDVVAIGSRADGAWADRLPAVPVFRPPRRPWAGLAALRSGRSRADLRWLSAQQGPVRAARAAWVAGLARRRRWDQVHAHFAGEAAEWAWLVARSAGVPYSVTVHATDLFKPRPTLGRLVRDAHPLVTVAGSNQRVLRERHGVEAEVVRCGVEVDRFTRCAADGPGPLRLVCVARDVPKKGLDGLVRIVRDLDGVGLRLVSDAHRLASPGVVVGTVAPSRLPRVLAAAHAFVLACRVAPDGDRDGIPVALIEAMAAGLPVIATAVNGVAELVDDTVGWLVPPDDPHALRVALVEARGAPGERRIRGDAARRRVIERGLTLEHQADGLLARWRGAPVAP